MKKLLCILTLSFANFGHAETTQVNIQSAALPQGMTQAQYQDLLINKEVTGAKAQHKASAKAKVDMINEADAAAKAKAAAYAKAKADAVAVAVARAKAKADHEEAKRKAEI